MLRIAPARDPVATVDERGARRKQQVPVLEFEPVRAVEPRCEQPGRSPPSPVASPVSCKRVWTGIVSAIASPTSLNSAGRPPCTANCRCRHAIASFGLRTHRKRSVAMGAGRSMGRRRGWFPLAVPWNSQGWGCGNRGASGWRARLAASFGEAYFFVPVPAMR